MCSSRPLRMVPEGASFFLAPGRCEVGTGRDSDNRRWRLLARHRSYHATTDRPPATRRGLMNRTFGCVRLVYNTALEERSRAWVTEQRNVTYPDTSAGCTLTT